MLLNQITGNGVSPRTGKLRAGLRLGAFFLAAALPSWGAVVSCDGSTISDIVTNSGGDGCQQVDKIFSGFVVGGGTSAAIDAGVGGQSNTPPSASELSLLGLGTTAGVTGSGAVGLRIFDSTTTSSSSPQDHDWFISTGDNTNNLTFTSNVTYTVNTTGSYVINGASFYASSISVDTSSGGPVVLTLTKQLCPGAATFSLGCSGLTSISQTFSNTNFGGGLLGTNVTFANQTVVSVRDTIFINLGTPNGNRGFNISYLENRFDQVNTIPEPGTIGLLGIAVTGLGFWKRRHNRKKKIA